MDKNVFRTRLTQCFVANGKKECDTAKEIGVSNSALNAYLGGNRTPTFENLYKLCSYFGISADWLMGLDGGKG